MINKTHLKKYMYLILVIDFLKRIFRNLAILLILYTFILDNITCDRTFNDSNVLR